MSKQPSQDFVASIAQPPQVAAKSRPSTNIRSPPVVGISLICFLSLVIIDFQ